ncbi:MAG: epoxyqueuosine reductase QueH [Treponema sp.]|nr:epoxyqueuosine reductase QueH [Treponema sp.]
MAKLNYQKQLDLLLDNLQQKGQSNLSLQQKGQSKLPTLLLHACCGPCSSYVLEYLATRFQITVYYYNPNIYPPQEYERRLEELKNFYPKFPPAVENNVKVIEESYNPEDFYAAVRTREEPALATEPEKGERCRRCYEFRLKKSFEYAKTHNFDYFCTTLSISPFKDAQKINETGFKIASENPDGPKWLVSDFKKKSGFLRSLQLSEEYNLYRQQYCGCIYSKQNKNDKV